MLLTEFAMAGGALYCGVKAYHKRQRQKTCALFLQPKKIAHAVHTGKEAGTEAQAQRQVATALAPEAEAHATPVLPNQGHLLALCQAVRREVSPWFTIPAHHSRQQEAAEPQRPLAPSQHVSSPTFEAADRALQAFVRRWIDPLFGDVGDRQLQALGVTLDMTALSPTERSMNRSLVISLATLGLTLASTLLFPPLLVLGGAGVLYLTFPIGAQAYRSL